jgi:hypothetical protein
MVERQKRQFSLLQVMTVTTIVCCALGVTKVVGFDMLWKIFVGITTVALVIDPLWRIYKLWREE